ncbi:DUF3500 domain-containing protein [Mangrovihabitans endophyticus]|uniref:DUF3500 domain-containing protein n=1 Tax=Mangrovihabitans endophyticus TaxID=1751298 RepID=A0A8J3BWS4_9ACTN|nr:DUF3500 domain-containing protein [Mangrovihabitans endophyticus]GGK75807.1 hypothetical protein GCM10012284_07240 [Mangrovihabitans endophyticus]
MTSADYRDYLIPADSPRLAEARGLDPWTYAKPIRATERARGLIALWQDLYRQPFRGITTDGTVLEGRYALADEGFDVRAATAAARGLLDTMTEGETARARYPIDAGQWRDWYNPEWPMNDHGIRLDQVDARVRDAVAALMRACLSDDGYVKTERVRSANLFLGELYDLRTIMNDWSYHFLLFGEPGETEPWGWNLYGHHLAVNCFVRGGQIVLSPTFLGAEPTTIDRGDGEEFELFRREALTGIELMLSLPRDQRERAQTYRRMRDPAMPADRWHFADERQLAGAYRDNRIIPYEGVNARTLTGAQQERLREVVASFLDLLPRRSFQARIRQVEAAMDDTWFGWIGPTDGVSPFYYRVQSPVILVEFDNHTGVWLTNSEPARFHVHTIVRTPNGNDYGKDLLRQHYAAAGHPH